MKMIQGQCDLSHIETDTLFRKPPLIMHVVKKLSTCHEIHHEVNPVSPLKDKLHLHDEWVVDLKHDHLFKRNRCDRIVIDNHIFAH